jgi:hypothetical protein
VLRCRDGDEVGFEPTVDALPPTKQPAVGIASAKSASGAMAAVRLVGTALRTWLQYLVPLTLLSALAAAPVVVLALLTPVPADAAAAAALRMRGWELAALGVFCQLLLVGGVAPATRRPSQLAALGLGAAQIARAVLPCLAAAAAIAIGSLALAVPGLLLVVLLALTGASPERGVAPALRDSIAAARAQLPAVAITVVAMLALDAAIAIAATRMFGAPLPRRATPQQLAMARHLVHAVALGLVVLSPVPATVLATVRRRAR